MPLNKLDNFIKNTEGRILYVNPSDLDASDSVDNQGNSLARPFKTIQRAIIEAARFSYVRGNNNDLIEKTTILLFPGEHVIDNRPGWAVYDNNGTAYAVPPSGGIGVPAQSILSLDLNSNFDLTQENNILYKFNSVYGGVPLPRGVSLVGLDLRKTKIRPKYVPNPTDSGVKKSAIFRLTGTCYIWQLSFFDGDEIGTVYTDPTNFSEERKSTPLFSHHKLTCFEYIDGVNDVIVGSTFYGLTDLDMYYSKLSNAFNSYRAIDDVDKYPENSGGFSKRTPEWEIVGAFATDPIDISNIISGNGTTASSRITVTTSTEHNLNVGTPVKIRGVSTLNYNISTKVQEVIDSRTFTYLLPSFPINLNANPSSSGATVIVETDTVTGASPYVFNCSLRSVWGMNGMLADGAKASGFRSMVVAQFTGVSLQKDDRAFVKYDSVSRTYNGVPIAPVYGSDLPLGASQTSSNRVYHLDSDAVYRTGWESSHIKITNDAFIQVVSVFAIGFTKHFDAETGGDFSITNSNSNFGQIALNSSGFRKAAFEKDDKAYITSIIPPKAIDTTIEEDISWLSLDVNLTLSVGNSSRLYLFGFDNRTDAVSEIIQGYRIGSRLNDKLYVNIEESTYSANILMSDGVTSSKKEYSVVGGITNNTFNIGTNTLSTGEKVIIRSDVGDLPEGLFPETVYYAIVNPVPTTIKLASTLRNAEIGEAISITGGTSLKIISRVSEKLSGEIGSPIQFDEAYQNWYINVNSGNSIYSIFNTLGSGTIGDATNSTYIKRVSDERSIDEKIYKLRVVIPKEATNAKDPEAGFVIQESSSTGLRNDNDFSLTSISQSDYDYKRNPRYISTCTYNSQTNTVTVLTELPHNLNVGDIVIIKGVQSTTNTIGIDNLGYNGTFEVASIVDDLSFRYSNIDVNSVSHSVGNYINDINVREIDNLPRFEKNNNKTNIYVYRNEVSSKYKQYVQDGVYYIYALNASNALKQEFTNLYFSQNPVDLYPQLDRDNVDDNPQSAVTYAKLQPIGDVETNDLKKSITRETIDKFLLSFGVGLKISSVISPTSTNPTITFSRRHGFGRIIDGVVSSGGSGYIPGTHYNVKLLNNGPDPNSDGWNGALATVTVNSSGVVTNVAVTNGGSGYGPGFLYFDSSRIGAGNGNAIFEVEINRISSNVGDVIQFTGYQNDIYHRITSIVSPTQITVARNSNDPVVTTSHYAFLVGPSIQISSSAYNSADSTQTIYCTSSHGLLVGNKVRIIDRLADNYQNMGDYIITSVQDVTTFTVKTFGSSIGTIANGYVLKHGLSANNASLDFTEENFGSRNTVIYDREVAILNTAINSNSTVTLDVSLIGFNSALSKRFPLGSYIQIDNEIMRITSNPSDSSIVVIRGVLGTRPTNHVSNSLIKKIKPLAVEFRRPSILRASGHTFEYLGYGPGNYSTALPQVQIKTLTDRESFLSQAQERSCGVIVYNGINNSGDVFNGNTKTLASSGEIISYDIPKPTITGQKASALTVVFDDATVKQRLLVEGGTSGTILSQFDGPVTFNNDVRVKGDLSLSGNFSVKSNQSIILEANSTIGGNLTVSDDLTVNGRSILNGEVVVKTGVIPAANSTPYLGSSLSKFSEAWVGEIGIATGGNDTTISAVSNSLRLDSTNDIELLKNTNVSGNITATGNIAIQGTLSAGRLVVPNISPIGSIMMWPGDVGDLPPEWKLCDGQVLTVGTTYTTLRDVLGNRYGGNGTTTVGLPDLRNYFILGAGNTYSINDVGGSATVTLSSTEIPSHTHEFLFNPAGNHTHGTVENPGETGLAGAHNHGPAQTPNETAGAGAHNHSPQSNGTVGPVGAHDHSPVNNPGQTGAAGDHQHNIQPNGGHSHQFTSYLSGQYRPGSNTALDRSQPTTANTQPAGNHDHQMQPSGNHRHPLVADGAHTHAIVAVQNHTHTLTAAQNHRHSISEAGDHDHGLEIQASFGTPTGTTEAHQNMPPYRALYYIIRVL